MNLYKEGRYTKKYIAGINTAFYSSLILLSFHFSYVIMKYVNGK